MNGRRPAEKLLLVLLGIVALAGLGHAQAPTITLSEVQLRLTLRDAWDVHARWTSGYVVSLLTGLPDSARVKARLFEGAGDLADALRPYHPGSAVPELANVLRRNVLLMGRAVAAVQSGDSAMTAAALANWSTGSDSLVKSLARINPNWPESKLSAPMQRYQDETWKQVLARARQDWTADILACDQAHIEALANADALSAGIVKQFPNKFR